MAQSARNLALFFSSKVVSKEPTPSHKEHHHHQITSHKEHRLHRNPLVSSVDNSQVGLLDSRLVGLLDSKLGDLERHRLVDLQDSRLVGLVDQAAPLEVRKTRVGYFYTEP